jgi:hypothetical protein
MKGLAALLSCWLCKLVLPHKEVNRIRPFCLQSSKRPAGRDFLWPVLASIYNGLRQLVSSSNLKERKAVFPIHYVYVWLGQYFETHHHHSRLRSGAQMIKLAGERMAKYFNALEAHNIFQDVNQSDLPNSCMSKDKQLIVVDDGNLSTYWSDYFINLRSSFLIFRCDNEHVIETYSPCRFSRQFGFCQDIPGNLKKELHTGTLKEVIQLWFSCTRLGPGSKVVIPARLSKESPLVTKEYDDWWSRRFRNFSSKSTKVTIIKRTQGVTSWQRLPKYPRQ